MRNRPWSGPVGSRRELLRLEWPPPSQSEITANRRQQRAEMLRQLNEGGRKLNVKIKRLHPEAVVPIYAKPGDSGFDLVATADIIIAPGETVLVPTGLSVELPEGYELQVRPRSGITLKTKLRVANSPGTVDSSYRGEVAVIVDNIAHPRVVVCDNEDGTHYTDTAKCNFALSIIGEVIPLDRGPVYELRTYIIRKGDRIAQGVIAPVKRVTFTEVDELGATERGSGGFGHSGVN